MITWSWACAPTSRRTTAGTDTGDNAAGCAAAASAAACAAAASAAAWAAASHKADGACRASQPPLTRWPWKVEPSRSQQGSDSEACHSMCRALVQPARRRLSGLPEHPRATRQQAMPHWRRSIGTGGLQDARTNLMDSLLSGRVKFVRNFP